MDRSRKAALLRRLAKYKVTKFQTTVLSATIDIPRGEVRTYKQIAQKIHNPKAYRAVGSALKANPFAPTVPCHRVIKSDGDTGNYSGKGGPKGKISMLKKEGALS